MKPPQSRPAYSPKPATIRAACERIQATWSEGERRRRDKTATNEVEIPVVAVAEFLAAVDWMRG